MNLSNFRDKQFSVEHHKDGTEPNVFLMEEGQNGGGFAERDVDITIVDLSSVGIKKTVDVIREIFG